jgi:hypothetical protein
MIRYPLLSFIALILVAGRTVQAQSFAPVGAFWCYTGSSESLSPESIESAKWTDTVRVEKDTIVNGADCRKLSVYRRERRLNFTDTFYTTANYYVYDNADTVFIYSPYYESFVPLYVFNVAIGDSICLPVPFPEFADNKSSYCFRVDSIKTEEFDGIPLKSVYVKTVFIENDTSSVGFGRYYYSEGNSGRYTERLGGSMPFTSIFSLIPTATHYDHSAGVHERKVAGLPIGTLSRYNDSQTNISLLDNDCDFIGAGKVSVNDLNRFVGLLIYPNPVSDILSITSPNPFYQNYQLNIFDIFGRRVRSEKIPKGSFSVKVDVTSLPAGVYHLELRGRENQYGQKLVIQ